MVLQSYLADLALEVLFLVIIIVLVLTNLFILLHQSRQARALNKLERQARQFMTEDLRLKRGHLEHEMADEIAVRDTKDWIEKVIGSVTGMRPVLQEIAPVVISEDPPVKVVQCDTLDFKRFILAPPIAEGQLYKMAAPRGNKLTARRPSIFGQNPRKNIDPVELSVLNAGIFFDQQAKSAWPRLTEGVELAADRLILYPIDLK